MEIFFLVIYAILLITWVIFPAMMILVSLLFKSPENYKKNKDFFFVSIIIAAHNESKNIANRINNIYELDYPKEMIEIIVVSDGSNDGTAEIANSFKNVSVIEFNENKGRAYAHNIAASNSNGEILIFSDAETLFASNFLIDSLKYFSNKNYGCGSGSYSFGYTESFGQSESWYWNIDKTIREGEFKLGVLPFASGGCLLVRASLYSQIPINSDIDNILPLRIISNGYKVFYAAKSLAYDKAVSSLTIHIKKRTRTTLRSLGDIFLCIPKLITKNKYLEVFILFFHKISRWATGVYIVNLIFISIYFSFIPPTNYVFLINLGIFFILMFFIAAFLGYLSSKFKKLNKSLFGSLLIFIFSFFMSLLSFTVAIFLFFIGRRIQGYSK